MPPWEKYAPSVEPGPWGKYGTDTAPPEPTGPSMGEVAGGAIGRGAMNLLNTPVALADMVVHAAIPSAFREKVPHLPNYPMQAAESIGLIDPAKQPQTPSQRIVDRSIQAGVQTGMVTGPAGLVVGAVSGGLAQAVKEYTGSELLAMATGVLTPLAFTSRTPSILTGTGKTTLKEAQQAGLVVQPTRVKPSYTMEKVESVAGAGKMPQAASLHNAPIFDKLAAQDIGLPATAEITKDALETIRRQAGTAYEDVNKLLPSNQLQQLKVKSMVRQSTQPGPVTGMKLSTTEGISPTTGMKVQEIRGPEGNLLGLKTTTQSEGAIGPLEGMRVRVTSRGPDVPGPIEQMRYSVKEVRGGNKLEQLKEARAEATAFYKHYNRSAEPASLRAANEASSKAKAIESEFEEAAIKAGRPDMVDRLRTARTLIAKTHDVERALLPDGHISANVLGEMIDQGKPLTGNLELIGRFAKTFPHAARDARTIPSPGVSGTDPIVSTGLGLAGYASGGSIGAAIGAGLPLLRTPARNYALSKGVQARLLREPSESISQAALRGALVGKSLMDYHDEVLKK